MRRSTWADTCSDAVDAVQENRRRLLAALGAEGMPLVVPNQVHGTRIVAIDDASDIEDACAAAAEGADGLLVGVPDVAALLCFADCVPVVVVSPDGEVRGRARRVARRRGPYRVPGRARARPARRAGRGRGMRAVRGPAARRGGCLQRVRRPMHPCRMLRLRSRRVRPVRRGLRRRSPCRSRGTWTCPRPSPATSSARAWMPHASATRGPARPATRPGAGTPIGQAAACAGVTAPSHSQGTR